MGRFGKQAFMMILLVATGAVAQTNKFPTTGNVGIGTLAPINTLSVVGTVGVTGTAYIGQGTNGTAVIDAYNGDA